MVWCRSIEVAVVVGGAGLEAVVASFRWWGSAWLVW